MYILLISRGIPSKYDPQWGGFEKDQAIALKKAGNKVVVISVDNRFNVKHRTTGIVHENYDGIDFYNIYKFPNVILRPLSYKLMLENMVRQMENLYKIVEREQGVPDIIYSHYLINSYAAINLKNRYKIPLVAIEHWSEVNTDKLKPYIKYMGNIVYKNADRVISVSETLRQRILVHFACDSEVVHNIVGEGFEYSPTDRNDRFEIVTVGSLFHIKGYDILINAIAKIKNKNIRLRIVGEGNQREKLQKLITKKHLEENVFLEGRKNRKEVADILNSSDIYVSSSRNENFSVSVLEALSVGLPVIATICGGIKECINDNNGILVPTEDVNALSSAIDKMHQTISKYDNKKISQDFQARFSTETIVNKLLNIFEHVIDKK